jgi:hypothetical protein
MVMTENEEQLAFYHQIGTAVTQWATVEFSLYDVVAACFGDRESLAVNVAFFSVENFRSKLQLVDNLVAIKFQNTPHFSEWIRLHERTRAAADARNTLVHYWVLIYPHEKPGRRWCLLPRLGKLRRRPPKRQQKVPAGVLCVRDVSLLAQRFSSLGIALQRFAAHRRGRQTLLPESEQQAARPMTLTELRRQIHALAGRPPRSSRR